MSKKDFTGGFDALLGEKKDILKSNEKKEVSKVITTIVTDLETLEKIKGISYWERLKMKEVITTALKEYINKYESTKGVIKLVSRDDN